MHIKKSHSMESYSDFKRLLSTLRHFMKHVTHTLCAPSHPLYALLAHYGLFILFMSLIRGGNMDMYTPLQTQELEGSLTKYHLDCSVKSMKSSKCLVNLKAGPKKSDFG